MSRLLGLLLSLVGYACVATVISAGLGYAYLRHAGKLDDEKMFRVVALVQGVDLEEIAKAKKQEKPGTPPEETSFQEQRQKSQTASLQFDAKQKQLADSLVIFNYQLKQLNDSTMRYASLRDEVRRYLEEQGKLVMSESMQKVRAQFELFDPKKQAAPLLRQYIDENRIDEVIMLLSSLKPQIQKEILRQFVEQEDRDRLYRIQRKMLAGEPMKPEIDARLKELEQLDAKQK
jgi:hypothetical protein